MTNCTPDTLIEKLIETAHRFRLGQEAEGSQRLRECIDHLEPMLPTLQQANQVIQLVPLMLAAQERHDWLGLADYLEYELQQLLA